MSNHNDREVLPLFLYNTWAEMEVQCQEIERFIEELTDSIKEQISVLESKKTELSDIKQILESLRNLEKSKLAKKQIEIDQKIQSIEAGDSAQIIISQENSHALEVRGAGASRSPELSGELAQKTEPSSDELLRSEGCPPFSNRDATRTHGGLAPEGRLRGARSALRTPQGIAPCQHSSSTESPTQEALTIPPQEMLRPQFRNMVQRRMLQQILESFDRKVHVREIAEIAYDCDNEEDLVRCVNSISTTLRSGAGKYWGKEGSSYFHLGLLEAQSQHRNGEVEPQQIERYSSREEEFQRVRKVIPKLTNGRVFATNGHR